MFRDRIVILAAATLLLMSACQQTRIPALLAPGTRVETGHFPGTPLSGPASRAAGQAARVVDARDCVSLIVTWRVLEKMPESILQPLGARARLIVAERSRQPVLPTTRLTLHARVGVAGDWAGKDVRMETVGKVTAALPVGVTLSCRLADPVRVVDPISGSPTARYVRVEAYRADSGNAITLALSVQDLVAPSSAGEDFVVAGAAEQSRKQKAGTLELQRETALLDATSLDKPMAIVLPFTLAGTPTRAVAVVVEVDPSPSPEQLAKQAEAATADLAQGAAGTEALLVVSSSWSAIAAAIGSLGREELRRPALVFLANETDAPVLADLTLVADESVLGRLVQQIRDQSTASADPAALGWALDRAAFDLLCELQSHPRMPKELEAVLAVHAGEAARHASSLDEIRNGLTTRAGFSARLLAENQIFLEDSSLASRIRAYDWLVQEGHAPPGYDPLGNPSERRAALDKYLQGAAATEPGTVPTSAPAGGAK